MLTRCCLLALLLAGCAGYQPADPANADRLETCKGTVANVAAPATGDVVFQLVPQAADARFLRGSQTQLTCTIAASRRELFASRLPSLQTGASLVVTGYWVIGPGGQSELLPVELIAADAGDTKGQ
jgi:hypothetical protein